MATSTQILALVLLLVTLPPLLGPYTPVAAVAAGIIEAARRLPVRKQQLGWAMADGDDDDRRDPAHDGGRRSGDKDLVARALAEALRRDLEKLGDTVHELAGSVRDTVHVTQETSIGQREHNAKCDGRDKVNAERFERIWDRLRAQDKILWAMIAVMGTVATGVAVMAWDVIKAKMGLH